VSSSPWGADVPAVLHWHEGDALPASLVHRAVRVCRAWEEQGSARTSTCTRTRRSGPVILVDGRSGSGKTTLADQLAPALRVAGLAGAQVLHLDSWYPGWEGLGTGTRITEQLLTGSRRSWPQWDWAGDRVARLVALTPDVPLVVEGAGALTAVTAGVSDLRIWVDADDGERHRRAMERDGDAYRPWWDMWARQEERHLDRHRPRHLADVVVRT
jgi:Uridine kinase